MFSFFFQKIVNNYQLKKNKKNYYILFSLFKFFIKKKIIVSFKKYKFYTSTDKKDLSRWILKNLKQWDDRNIQIIIKLVKKYKASFIDCGCNFGAYSVPIAKNFKNQKIYAFDASEIAINKLRENINLNNIKNIKYFNFGIGEKNEEKIFDQNIENFKNNGSYRFTNKKNGKKVKIFSLDYLLRRKKINLNPIVIVKIDIEGYDYFALKGMNKIIKKHNVIIFFELSKILMKNTKNFNIKFIKFLKKRNFRFFDLDLNEKNVTLYLNKLKNISKTKETLGDFIISNFDFKKKFKFKKISGKSNL